MTISGNFFGNQSNFEFSGVVITPSWKDIV